MDTTKELLKDYKELRDTIVEYGPNDRLLARRRVYEVEMRSQQIEQAYLALKSNYPDPIEFLELAKPLDAAALKNLNEAAAVNEEIGKLLDGSKRSRKKAAH